MFAIETNVDADTAAHWLMVTYLGIALWRYIVALGIIGASMLLKKVLEVVAIRWLNQLFSKTMRYQSLVFEAISKPLNAFLLVLGVHLALFVLRTDTGMSPDVARFGTSTVYIAFGLVAVWAAYRLVGTFTDILDDLSQRKAKGAIDKQFIPLIKRSMRIAVLVLGLLTVLSSMHVDVGSLVTGLGIGGAAMALAAQDSLGNIFGSVALLADRSIKVGDWIIIGDKVNGIVESIGLRSTKIRTWPKTLMTIPNKMLANEIIDNWSQMPKRRVKQTVGIEYCRPDQMETILEDIREILRKDPGVDQEMFLVYWTEFATYSLDILVYYFTKDIGWEEHLICKERINFKILAATLSRGVNMAFPTQNVLLQNQNQSAPVMRREDEVLV